MKDAQPNAPRPLPVARATCPIYKQRNHGGHKSLPLDLTLPFTMANLPQRANIFRNTNYLENRASPANYLLVDEWALRDHYRISAIGKWPIEQKEMYRVTVNILKSWHLCFHFNKAL